MDLIILLVLIAIVVFFFKRFSSFVYFIVIVDIFLRMITFINENLLKSIGEVYRVIHDYIPANVPSIMNAYSSGIFNTVLIWGYVAIFAIFEYYIILTFFRKK